MKPFKPRASTEPPPLPSIKNKRNKLRGRPSKENNKDQDVQAEFILKKMFLDFNRMVKTGYRNTRKVVGNYIKGVRRMTGSSSSSGGSTGGTSSGSGSSNKKYKNYDRVDEEEVEDKGLYVDMSPVWGVLYDAAHSQ